jgi:hypothetical protein
MERATLVYQFFQNKMTCASEKNPAAATRTATRMNRRAPNCGQSAVAAVERDEPPQTAARISGSPREIRDAVAVRRLCVRNPHTPMPPKGRLGAALGAFRGWLPLAGRSPTMGPYEAHKSPLGTAPRIVGR